MSEPVTHGTALGYLTETAAGVSSSLLAPADATHHQREPLPRGSQRPARPPGDLGGLGVTPRRIQRQRTKGWRMPAGAIYVGRPSKYSNPFRIGGLIDAVEPGFVGLILNVTWRSRPLVRSGSGIVEDAQHAVDLYEFWVRAMVPFTRAEVEADLGGRDLVCWCALEAPCHADLLLPTPLRTDDDYDGAS